MNLNIAYLDTPLGTVMAISNSDHLHLLKFDTEESASDRLNKLQKKWKCGFISERSQPIDFLENELALYFSGKLARFQTPLLAFGSAFQKQVWEELKRIPFGETRSYLDVAKNIGRPTASRAVAQANASNPIAILVPCHRVIQHDGKLGGYACGVSRKVALLDLEKSKK